MSRYKKNWQGFWGRLEEFDEFLGKFFGRHTEKSYDMPNEPVARVDSKAPEARPL